MAQRKTLGLKVPAYDLFWDRIVGDDPLYHGNLTEVFEGELYEAGSNGPTAFVLGKHEAEDGESTADGKMGRVRSGVWRWDNSLAGEAITVDHIGQYAYAVSGSQVGLTDAGGTLPVAGQIVDVDAFGVWVLSGFGHAPPPDLST